MSLISRVQDALTSGGMAFQIAMEPRAVPWKGRLQGTATLVGGRTPMRVNQVNVGVVEHWEAETRDDNGNVERRDHYLRHQQIHTPVGAPFGSGQQQVFPFDLEVPWGRPFSHEWYVEAQAEMPGAVDCRAQAHFTLLPPEPFRRLSDLLAEITTIPADYWVCCRQGAAAEHLPKTEALKQQLDGIRLEMELEGSEIAIQVVVNPQEHNLGDRLRALVRADLKKFTLRAPEDNPEAVRESLRQIVEPFLGR
ncbi:MAG: hypothetical protein FJX77_06370 [Armatimonadetes bacterium]|nr:hypothetical protein [Armatimonadota bacterium]